MAEKLEDDLVVKPQQLIGGINDMILQLHKFQVEQEESRQKYSEQTEKIKSLEVKTEKCRNEINELTKTKERLTEQSGFLQKSLDRKRTENNELLQRLKQAEIQLGESGSVLATVKNLESKNEVLSEKMSNVLLNTEEEVAKVKTEREHYLKLLEETSVLNKRNVEIQNELVKEKEIGGKHAQQAEAFVKKSEKLCVEISKTLEEIQLGKQQFMESNSDRVRNCLKENASLLKENKDLKQAALDLEKKLNEHQKGSHVLKEQLMKTEAEKQELLKEVDSLHEEMQEKSAKSNAEANENAKKSKQYEALEQQLKQLNESYSEATQQLGQLRESVDESKNMLKANIEKEENADAESGDDDGCGKIAQDYVAVVVEMQGIFQQSDIRDEELASLENIAGIPRQRFKDIEGNEGTGMASCIRGLVAIKDSQINALTKERDDLSRLLSEKKKIEYRQAYQLGELQKENNEMLAKMEACQAKYRKLKEDKEDIRQQLLVKNAADKITHSYINKLKHENENHKANLQTHQETLKKQFQAIVDELDEKLEGKNASLQTMQEKITLYQRERDALKSELNSRQKKDNAIKEQIISMFGN